MYYLLLLFYQHRIVVRIKCATFRATLNFVVPSKKQSAGFIKTKKQKQNKKQISKYRLIDQTDIEHDIASINKRLHFHRCYVDSRMKSEIVRVRRRSEKREKREDRDQQNNKQTTWKTYCCVNGVKLRYDWPPVINHILRVSTTLKHTRKKESISFCLIGKFVSRKI